MGVGRVGHSQTLPRGNEYRLAASGTCYRLHLATIDRRKGRLAAKKRLSDLRSIPDIELRHVANYRAAPRSALDRVSIAKLCQSNPLV